MNETNVQDKYLIRQTKRLRQKKKITEELSTGENTG